LASELEEFFEDFFENLFEELEDFRLPAQMSLWDSQSSFWHCREQ
jgi:hypothetical protein